MCTVRSNMSLIKNTTPGAFLSKEKLNDCYRGCDEVLKLEDDRHLLMQFVESRMGKSAEEYERANDLTLFAGETMKVLQKNDHGWWYGAVNRSSLLHKGFFPGNYVKPVVIIPDAPKPPPRPSSLEVPALKSLLKLVTDPPSAIEVEDAGKADKEEGMRQKVKPLAAGPEGAAMHYLRVGDKVDVTCAPEIPKCTVTGNSPSVPPKSTSGIQVLLGCGITNTESDPVSGSKGILGGANSVHITPLNPTIVRPFVTSQLALTANICAEETSEKTVSFAEVDWLTGLPDDRITKLTVNNVPVDTTGVGTTQSATTSVSMLVLPAARPWPTFRNSKHEATQGRDMVIIKSAPLVIRSAMDNTPTASILDTLLGGRKVVLAGHPGVGKSTELNIVLVDLFRALRDGKLKVVYHRVSMVLYIYRCSETKGVKSITCEKLPDVGDTPATLNKYSNTSAMYGYEGVLVNKPSAVLVLELDEDEGQPKMIIPTLLALSAPDLIGKLKNWHKGGRIAYCTRPTHTAAELLVLATAMFLSVDNQEFLHNLALPSTTSSVGDVHRVVQQRMRIIGPLAREVLGPANSFHLWQRSMEKVTVLEEFLDMTENVDEFTLPKTAEFFFAPNEYNEIKFLSSHATELVLRNVKNRNKEHISQLYGWQGAEHILLNYFVMDQHWRKPDW